MYNSLVPTLVIPAHYMNLSSELPGLAGLGAGEQGLGNQGNQGSLTLPRARPSQGEQSQAQRAEAAAPVRIPVRFNDSAMAQVSEELQGLTESQLLELGIKPNPQAWFVSLDGQSNSLRHSFIELGAGIGARAGPGVGRVGGSRGASLRMGVDRKSVV